MPELRQNFMTKEWVVIATERAKRPDQMVVNREHKPPVPFSPNCPFCPGNENMTPPEILRLHDGNSWKARVVPNKFAALSPEAKPERIIHRSRRRMGGFGEHDVIVETPDHSLAMAMMPDSQVSDILRIYKTRYDQLSLDPRIAQVTIFKNHGTDAGTSLEHPHSQMIATPVISYQVRQRFQEAMQHFDDFGCCMFCQIIEEETRRAKARGADQRTLRSHRTVCLTRSVLHAHLSAAAHGELRRCQFERNCRLRSRIAHRARQALRRPGESRF